MNYEQLINEAQNFVTDYIHQHENPNLLYHNQVQIQNAVSVTRQLAKHLELNEKDFFIVTAAAWFVYTGWYKNVLHPEEASAKIAAKFFLKSAVEEDVIHSVDKCILATANTKSPETVLEKIMCDAVSYYVGTENFSQYNRLRLKEFALLNNTKFNKQDWRKSSIKFLETHQFYTDFCKEHLDKNKMYNLKKLKKKEALQTQAINPVSVSIENQNGLLEEKEKYKRHKSNSSEKTIETMFRTTSSNSQRLSSQADTKAHILISVNSIIISVLLSVVVTRMADYSRLTIPVIMLLLVNLITISFSILATRPNIPRGIFDEDELKQNKVNLLFFGNFFKMKFDDYSNFMQQVMGDQQILYVTMLRNLHEQGVVLGKKYKLLKTAYNFFMYGLIISVITFFIVSKFMP